MGDGLRVLDAAVPDHVTVGMTDTVDEDVRVLDSEKVGVGWLQVAERERLRTMLKDAESVPVGEHVLVGATVTLPVWE